MNRTIATIQADIANVKYALLFTSGMRAIHLHNLLASLDRELEAALNTAISPARELH